MINEINPNDEKDFNKVNPTETDMMTLDEEEELFWNGNLPPKDTGNYSKRLLNRVDIINFPSCSTFARVAAGEKLINAAGATGDGRQ